MHINRHHMATRLPRAYRHDCAQPRDVARLAERRGRAERLRRGGGERALLLLLLQARTLCMPGARD